jgi:hypothetical protein
MKKLFFLFIAIVFFSSCKKTTLPTTYQIFNSTTPISTGIQYLDGSVYEVIVCHYSENKIIHQDTIDEIDAKGGKTALIDVPAKTELLKVSYKFLPSKSPYYNIAWNVRFYLVDFKIITRETNNIIGINGSSYISDTIVKSDNQIDFIKGMRTINKITTSLPY